MVTIIFFGFCGLLRPYKVLSIVGFWNPFFQLSGWKSKIPKSCARKTHFLQKVWSRKRGVSVGGDAWDTLTRPPFFLVFFWFNWNLKKGEWALPLLLGEDFHLRGSLCRQVKGADGSRKQFIHAVFNPTIVRIDCRKKPAEEIAEIAAAICAELRRPTEIQWPFQRMPSQQEQKSSSKGSMIEPQANQSVFLLN